MSRVERLGGRRGDMTSTGRHGVKVDKEWRDRKTLEPERLPNLRGSETRVRGARPAEENED